MIQVSKLCFLFQNILNLWPVLILEIFSRWDIKKGQFKFLVTFLAVFFWSVNCTILACKLCLLFQTILNLWPVLILEIFSGWGIKKGQFQFLVTFVAVFFWSVNCTNLVCISSYFEHGQCFIWGILVFIFLGFSVFDYLKSVFSGNFSCSGNITVLVCKLYMPDLSIILLFWTCPKF